MTEYAVKRATAEDLDRMRAAVERMSTHETLDDFFKSDIDFHFAIVEATHEGYTELSPCNLSPHVTSVRRLFRFFMSG